MFDGGQEKGSRMTINQVHWRGLFTKSLYKIFQDNHPGIGVDQLVVEQIEELIIRLLFELLECRPTTTQDLEKRIQSTFPAPINEWATAEAENAIKLAGKKHPSKIASNKPMLSLVGKVHPMLRDHLGYKIDEKLTLYVISMLEYIASDIIKTTGNYVKNIRNTTATLQDLNIALRADKVLMDIMEMLYNDEGEHPSYAMGVPENGEDGAKQKAQELTYEKASRDLIHEESQYLREINLLVHVFRRDFEVALGNDGKEYVESLFGNIVDIHELTVGLLRSLEDAVEMSDSPCVGSCFWELAEGQEFDVYHQYVQEVCKRPTDDIIERLLNALKRSKFFDVSSRGGRSHQASHTNGFRLAVKYVLPTLLQAPVFHCYRYFDYLATFRRLADNEADVDDLISSLSYFDNLKAKLDLSCTAQLKRQINEQNQRGQPETQRSKQLRRLQEIQKTIEGWEGNEIGYTCSEFIRDGSLMKLRPKQGALGAADTLRKGRGTSFTERYVFLFDHLIVLCKLTHRTKERNEFKYKFKEKLPIRKTDIFDLEDSDDLKNAFEICYTPPPSKCEPPTVWTLCCKSAEVKQSWMAALVMLQTRSMLDRMLDVYLKEEEKRIPLVLPTQEQYRFAEPDTDENIFFEDYTSSSGIPVVKNGTVVKLVERLTYHLYADNKYVATFLTTFRSFCSPNELLNLLIERFHVPTPQALQPSDGPQRNGGLLLGGRYDTVQSPSLGHHHFDLNPSSHYEQSYQRFRKEYMRPIQLRVLYVIRQWVNNHWYDFDRDADLLVKLESFVKQIHSNLHKKFIQIIQSCIDRRRRNAAISEDPDRSAAPRATNVSDFGPKPPPPVWHTAKPGDTANYDLLTLHPLEIGRQVTLLQSDLYRAVKPIELVGAAWTKHDKDIRSPQLLKLTQHSTMLTYWIARAIVETPSMEERVAMFSRVLEVMSVFEELNNFTGLVAFYSALNSSSVYRLKACWEKLDREKQTSYSRFKSLCNPHWTEMIERLRSINPPCVPFFGHYLSRIFFFEEGNSTFVSHPDEELNHDQHNSDSVSIAASKQPLVSFTKCRKIASIIADIQMYQNQPYALQVEPSIRQFFETINPLSGFEGKEALETYLFDQSHKVEPKDPEKWEIVKPSRQAHVLKSPGIKPPKVSAHHPRSTAKHAISPINSFNSYVTEDSRQPSSPTEDNAFAIVDINPGHQPRYVRDVPDASSARHLPGSPSHQRVVRTSRPSTSTPPSPTHTPAPPLPPRRQPSPLPPPVPKPSGARDKSNSPRSPMSPVASAEAAFVFPPRKPTGVSASSTASNLSPESSSPFDSGRRGGSAAPVSSSSPSPPTVPPRRQGDMLPAPLPLDSFNKVWNGQVGAYNISATLSPPLKTRSTSASSSAAPSLPPRTPRGSAEPPPRPPKRSQRSSPVTPLSPINNDDHQRSSSVPHDGASALEAPPLPPKTYKPRRNPL